MSSFGSSILVVKRDAKIREKRLVRSSPAGDIDCFLDVVPLAVFGEIVFSLMTSTRQSLLALVGGSKALSIRGTRGQLGFEPPAAHLRKSTA